MSMVPARDPAICPVCGERHATVGGSPGMVPAFACPGPKVHWSGARVLRDVELVSWGPDLTGFTDLVQASETSQASEAND